MTADYVTVIIFVIRFCMVTVFVFSSAYPYIIAHYWTTVAM